MAARYRAPKVDPAMDDLDVDPLISARQKEIVEGFVNAANPDRILAQATIVETALIGGHYFAPTLYGGIDPDGPLAQSEIFGPVQVIIPFDTEADAVNIANGTAYGLVASIWTRDGARQMGVAKAIRSAIFSSTTTALVAAWSCPSAGLENPAMAAKKASRLYTDFPSSKPSPPITGDGRLRFRCPYPNR
mgnify:CR=1 FL=1